MATISNIDIGSTSITTLGVVTTGTWSATTPSGLTHGTTNANLTAANGGILYSTASALAIKAATATANQALTSGVSTTPVWTTNTWPTTVAAGSLLTASATNVISARAPTASAMIIPGTNGTGQPVWLALTNGKIVVYSASNSSLNAMTVTSVNLHSPLGFTAGAGSLTLSSVKATNSNSGTGGNQTSGVYLINNGGSLVTFTVSATSATYDVLIIIGGSSGGWKRTENNTSGVILLPGGATTTATSGTIASSLAFDCLTIMGTPSTAKKVATNISGNLIYT